MTKLWDYAEVVGEDNIEQLMELSEELPENWWSEDKVNLQRCRVELVDVFHFFLSTAMALGFDAETFLKAYYAKVEVNLTRWSEGYEKRPFLADFFLILEIFFSFNSIADSPVTSSFDLLSGP